MKHRPVIRDAGIQDLDVLVDTLSDAFRQDPVLDWLIPRGQLYTDYFRLLIEDAYLPREPHY